MNSKNNTRPLTGAATVFLFGVSLEYDARAHTHTLGSRMAGVGYKVLIIGSGRTFESGPYEVVEDTQDWHGLATDTEVAAPIFISSLGCRRVCRGPTWSCRRWEKKLK